MTLKNFLPNQYEQTDSLHTNHNYLTEQFSDYPEIFEKIAAVVRKGDFTLGHAVDEFEARFAETVGVKHAIGVGSGTDALFLSLKSLGVGPGDEVITTAFTFYATIGAIVTAGAKPVFVDVLDDFNIDPDAISAAITDNTKAILPVHWSGKPCRMDNILEIANAQNIPVVEDSCHGIHAIYKGQSAGSFGAFGCFSMHPLKNLNVWGDGGVACTNSDELARQMRLIRNHGLTGRDDCEVFAYNSRLDTIQAVVANHLMDKIELITKQRIAHAAYLDDALSDIPQVIIPPRDIEDVKHVYHIYSLRYERRDELQTFLIEHGVDAKVHYPTPMHLQPAAKEYGYKRGDIPKAEAIADSTLSLPVHEFITKTQLDRTASFIKEFYQL